MGVHGHGGYEVECRWVLDKRMQEEVSREACADLTS